MDQNIFYMRLDRIGLDPWPTCALTQIRNRAYAAIGGPESEQNGAEFVRVIPNSRLLSVSQPNVETVETKKGTLAMKFSIPQKLITLSVLGLAAAAFTGTSYAAVNADAAAALAKKSDCLKCHAIDKDKKAASYKKIAEKYKGKADAEAKLMDVLTKSPKVKQQDGTEEEHKAVASKDAAEIKNLIGWILAQ